MPLWATLAKDPVAATIEKAAFSEQSERQAKEWVSSMIPMHAQRTVVCIQHNG